MPRASGSNAGPCPGGGGTRGQGGGPRTTAKGVQRRSRRAVSLSVLVGLRTQRVTCCPCTDTSTLCRAPWAGPRISSGRGTRVTVLPVQEDQRVRGERGIPRALAVQGQHGLLGAQGTQQGFRLGDRDRGELAGRGRSRSVGRCAAGAARGCRTWRDAGRCRIPPLGVTSVDLHRCRPTPSHRQQPGDQRAQLPYVAALVHLHQLRVRRCRRVAGAPQRRVARG